jgi:hypothetical protein
VPYLKVGVGSMIKEIIRSGSLMLTTGPKTIFRKEFSFLGGSDSHTAIDAQPSFVKTGLTIGGDGTLIPLEEGNDLSFLCNHPGNIWKVSKMRECRLL